MALKDKLLQSADSQAQWLTKKVASLEKEVESLNAVLELKVREINYRINVAWPFPLSSLLL